MHFCDFKITSENYTPLKYVIENNIQSLVLYQIRKLVQQWVLVK